MSTSQRRAALPTEDEETAAVAAWLDLHGWLYCHVPNEATLAAALSKAPKIARIRFWQKRKAMGVKKGTPDLLIFERIQMWENGCLCKYKGIAIEMKRQDGTWADVTPDQREWLDNLSRRGWLTAWYPGAEEAIRWLGALAPGRVAV